MLEAVEERVIARVGFAVNGLHAGGVVDVGDRGNRRAGDVEPVYPEQTLLLFGHRNALRGGDVRDEQHVRAVVVEIKPIGDVLAQNRRRERAERLAIFDLEVEHFLHGR